MCDMINALCLIARKKKQYESDELHMLEIKIILCIIYIIMNMEIEKLYKYDYVIFLAGKFNGKFNWIKKKIYTLFDTNKTLYFNYSDKNDIIKKISDNNCTIKMNRNKQKLIFFNENNIEPDILYKKLIFSKQELFIPLENYANKKIEFKLKSFCQITSKLGVQSIDIQYNLGSKNNCITSAGFQEIDTKLGFVLKNKNEKDSRVTITLEFPKEGQNYNINLNDKMLIDRILDEEEFFISKDEFLSDMDLQMLIDSRCNNFISSYNTSISVEKISNLERNLFIDVNKCGFEIGNSDIKNELMKINILVNFMNIYNNFDCIDGTNINYQKIGFDNLTSLIKKEIQKSKNETKTPYNKLHKFLKYHIKYTNNNEISKYKHLPSLTSLQIFNDIMSSNFNNDGINDLYYSYFKDNLTYDHLEHLEDIIINGSFDLMSILKEKNDNIAKLYFISFQYHEIRKFQNIIMEYINKCILDIINEFIEHDKNILPTIREQTETLNQTLSTIEHKKSEIITLINKAFYKSFAYDKGLADTITDDDDSISPSVFTTISNIIQNVMHDEFSQIHIDPLIGVIIVKGVIYKLCNEFNREHKELPRYMRYFDIDGTILIHRVMNIIEKLSMLFIYDKHDYNLIKENDNDNDDIKDIQKSRSYYHNLVISVIPLVKYYFNYRFTNIYVSWNDYKRVITQLVKDDENASDQNYINNFVNPRKIHKNERDKPQQIQTFTNIVKMTKLMKSHQPIFYNLTSSAITHNNTSQQSITHNNTSQLPASTLAPSLYTPSPFPPASNIVDTQKPNSTVAIPKDIAPSLYDTEQSDSPNDSQLSKPIEILLRKFLYNAKRKVTEKKKNNKSNNDIQTEN